MVRKSRVSNCRVALEQMKQRKNELEQELLSREEMFNEFYADGSDPTVTSAYTEDIDNQLKTLNFAILVLERALE